MKSTSQISRLLQQAVAHHQAGQLDAAEACYAQVVEADRNNVDALNLLGALAHSRDQNETAKTFFYRAMACGPNVPEVHFNLANLLSSIGDIDGALGAYARAVELRPAYADSHLNMGVLLYKSDRTDEALGCFRKAVAAAPQDARGHYNLGQSFLRLSRAADAEASLLRAIELNPAYLDAHLALASIYTDRDQVPLAILHLRRAISVRSLPEYHSNLGDLLKRSGDLDAALEAHRVAMEGKPDDPIVMFNCAVALHAAKKFDEARDLFRSALIRDPNFIKAYVGLAKVYEHQGLFASAIEALQLGLGLDPNSPEMLLKLSMLQLATGSFKEGWRNYECRMTVAVKPQARRAEPPAYWAGEDLRGKAIVLWSEQGLGDEILYGSMIPEIAARSDRCIVECTPRMAPIFARSFPQTEVIPYLTQGITAVPAAGIDFQLALGSLGRFVRPNFSSFPRVAGYLKAEPVRTAALRARYRAIAPGNLVVGLSWRSKNEEIGALKSLGLAHWTDILSVRGVTFVNLQYGDCAAELTSVKRTIGIDVYTDDEIDSLKSMDEFFAQVAAMDLVISTSNTTIHVAGSLNIPVWLLLSAVHVGLWYWFLDREESPWYPSLRIIRSSRQKNEVSAGHEWRHAISEAGRNLRDLAQRRV